MLPPPFFPLYHIMEPPASKNEALGGIFMEHAILQPRNLTKRYGKFLTLECG